MALFGGGARKRNEERQRLEQSWRGRLNPELWNLDPSRAAYFERAVGIEHEFAHAALEFKLGDPLPKKAALLAKTLLPGFVPLHQLSPIVDGMRTSYLLSFGETWDQLGTERVRQIARECCAAAARDGIPEANEPRMRSGSAIAGLVSCHPEHPRPLAAFGPIHRYFTAQAPFQRLRETAPHVRWEVEQAFFRKDLIRDKHEEVKRSYALTWYLGMALWLWQWCGFFENLSLSKATGD